MIKICFKPIPPYQNIVYNKSYKIILILFFVKYHRFHISFKDGFQLIYLIILCTTLPFFLILYGMKHVSATASGILLSLESVMAAFMGIVVLHEPFTLNLFIGGTIIMFSFVLSEILPKVLKK